MVASCRFHVPDSYMCVLRKLRAFWYTRGGFGFTICRLVSASALFGFAILRVPDEMDPDQMTPRLPQMVWSGLANVATRSVHQVQPFRKGIWDLHVQQGYVGRMYKIL